MKKIAIVHDWLVDKGGAENVLEQLLKVHPNADIFCVIDFMASQDRSFLIGHKIKTSFIQKIPFAKKYYRAFLPLMPFAIEQFDLTEYDLVISSSHAVAKGVIVSPDQIHICMCYSPIRYAWDMQTEYLKRANITWNPKGILYRYLLHKIRIWDSRTANGVDQFVAISKFIERRILKCYRRNSVIIYPPVDLENFKLTTQKSDYYLCASRLVPYKNIPLIIEAFNAIPHITLRVIGDGPELQKCRKLAKSNVEILGYQSKDELIQQMQNAKAFVFAAKEDFGIVPIEAQACGTPVIAYGKGAAAETIKVQNSSNPSGVFFYSLNSESILEAVSSFEKHQTLFTPRNCRLSAERFSTENFHKNWRKLVSKFTDQDS